MPAQTDPLVAAWLESTHVQPGTLSGYRAALASFTEWCESRSLALAAVGPDDLARYATHLNGAFPNPTSAKGHHATVRRFYAWLFSTGQIATNPDVAGARARANVPVEVDPLVAIYLGSKNLSKNGRNAYKLDLGLFTTWCHLEIEVALADVTADHIARYVLHLDQTHTNVRTAHARRASVRRFYTWLFENGKVQTNPAAKVDPAPRREDALTPVLTVTEVRALIAVAVEPMDRAVLLMTAVLGMPIREITVAQVTDLREYQGEWSLTIPSRPVVLPLPDFVAASLAAAVGGRTRGDLVLNKRGQTLTRPNQTLLIARLSQGAKLGFRVSPGMLVATCRAEMLTVAPALNVYQGFGFGVERNLVLRAKSAAMAKPHLTYLASSHFRPDAGTTDALLDASAALGDRDRLPLAAQVAVAGSGFERHLRQLAYDRHLLDPAEEKPTNIAMLQGMLRGAGVFRNPEVQAIATVQEIRDWAAHGWYEKVTEEVADRALEIMRRITRAHPLA